MYFTVEKARKYAGLTQAEMGKRMKIHRHTYAKIEKYPERATVEQAKMIADITKIPIDDIFFSNNSTLNRQP